MTKNSKEYSNEYYQKNKEKRLSKVFCECCQIYCSRNNLSTHNKTAKHIRNSLPTQSEILTELEAIKQELEDIKKSKQDSLMYCWGCQESFPESEKTKHKCSSKHRNL